MAERSLEKLGNGVDRLLEAYDLLKAENLELKQRVAALESRQTLFKDRLDAMIARIEGVGGQ